MSEGQEGIYGWGAEQRRRSHEAQAIMAQGEDHEILSKACAEGTCGCRPPSPERNTEKLVEALREIERLGDTDGPAAPLLVRAGDLAREALAEFSSTTKEQG
jgi:hypothetical protein